MFNSSEEKEILVLLDEIQDKYGYDFREYTISSLQRRINKYVIKHNFKDLEELKREILNNEKKFDSFLEEIVVNVTEMFRDPTFFLELRKKVFPALSTYPYIKIWDAGCSTGEELFSLAIILHEEGLLQKTKIYATDISQKVLLKAKDAILPLSEIKKYSDNYIQSGGKKSFSDYYYSNYDSVIFNQSLLDNIIFYPHNLVSDSSFNEFHLIICRNVLIYFNRNLQEKVIKLFSDSLVQLGYIALGRKETLLFSNLSTDFEIISKAEKIYRKNSF